VSTEILKPLPAKASITGITRDSSISIEIGSAPGRVDSPPMSRMSAPCFSSSIARSIASSGLSVSPPSEKLSGVTLTTPSIKGRSMSSPAKVECFSFLVVVQRRQYHPLAFCYLMTHWRAQKRYAHCW